MQVEDGMRQAMRIVTYAPPRIVYQLAEPVMPDFIEKARSALFQVTGQNWTIEQGEGEASPSFGELERQQRELENQQREEARQAVLRSPLVKAALEAFPDAKLIEDDNPPAIRSANA